MSRWNMNTEQDLWKQKDAHTEAAGQEEESQ